jgi:hypothetical protein
MGIDASVTLSSSTDLVLVLVTAVYNADAIGNAKFTIFRDSGEISSGLTLQIVSGSTAGKNRQVTMAYVDAPGSTGTKTYSAMAAKLNAGDGTFSVSESSRDLRQTIAIVLPPSLLKYSTSTASQTVSATTWTTVDLSVTVTPFDATDAVLILVNLNFNPATAASVGACTIFQDETNLGHATSGIAYAKTPTAGESAIMSMSYLHLPGTNSAIVYSVRCLAVTGSFSISANSLTRSIAALIQAQKPPTAAPTAAPSFAPTRIPTAVPTTATPTITPDDCRTGCSYPAVQTITGKTFVKQMQLPPSFILEFEVTVPALRSWAETQANTLPLIELVDGTGNRLLALVLTDTTGMGVIYNGESLVSYGVNIASPSINTYTDFKISVLSNQVRVVASTDWGWTASYTISGAVDTTGLFYSMYLSSTTTDSGTTGGSFRSISITRKFLLFLC